ncbi:MAG TPA: serine/threonine-protein kinase [Kofleriaceae bacterium]|nr:serine/threonine-protein kinase [Kofleriaceae bacterium]
MGGDDRDLGLSDTAQAPPPAAAKPLDATLDASVHPLAAGTAKPRERLSDTALASPSSSLGASRIGTAREVAFARATNVVLALLSTVHIAYFVVRFLVADSPPALHKAYIGRVNGGPFQAMDIFNGPFLTLARITLVATVFVAVSVWVARYHPKNRIMQLVASAVSVAGQSSVAVAVLTSQETLLAPRIVAAVIYVVMPLSGFTIIALFPNGKPVPRWALGLIPIGTVPFAIQAGIMFFTRGFSVPVAAACFPFGLVALAMMSHRYRTHATLREQHQIKWLAYAGIAFLLLQAIVIALIPLLMHPESPAFPFIRVLFELVLASSYLVALACMLFSAARYRLWDIDRVINRTIVYVLVTAMLGAACVLGYFGLRAALSTLPAVVSIAISIGLMAALFAPARRRIGRFIDRKFYGIGLDYERLAAKAVHAARASLPTISTELGAYDELVLLGRGGMGAVYRAHHPDFGVPVALKVMSPKLADDPDAQARFRREAQLLEDLQHPNVIPFLAAGHENGLAFIAMQYVDGQDLSAVVRARRRLSLAEVVPIIDGVAAALDVAHEAGIVHRDIKPANIFIEAGGKPLVMDFGVALLAGDARAADGSLVGSLPYIAPEQIHNADAVDRRADIYALGATVYEMVTGRPPFVETTALGLVLAHLHQPPVDPRDHVPTLSSAASLAILKALSKAASERFGTAGEFAAALRA